MGQITDEFFAEGILFSQRLDIIDLRVRPLDDIIQSFSIISCGGALLNRGDGFFEDFDTPSHEGFNGPLDNQERGCFGDQTSEKRKGPEMQCVKRLEQNERGNSTQNG